MNITKQATFAAACAAATTLAVADDVPTVKLLLWGPVDATHAAFVYERIRSAARQVCEPLESKELTWRRAHDQCVDQAVAQAVAQVNLHALTELHLSRNRAMEPLQR
jgi:UrcA family protein